MRWGVASRWSKQMFGKLCVGGIVCFYTYCIRYPALAEICNIHQRKMADSPMRLCHIFVSR